MPLELSCQLRPHADKAGTEWRLTFAGVWGSSSMIVYTLKGGLKLYVLLQCGKSQCLLPPGRLIRYKPPQARWHSLTLQRLLSTQACISFGRITRASPELGLLAACVHKHV